MVAKRGEIMANINYSESNFRFVIVDDYQDDKFCKDECFFEFRIKKSFLKKLLGNALNTMYEPLDIVLTSREIEVLKYLADGLNNYEIAKKLNITVHTAKAHIHNIFDKLSVQGRTKAVIKAVKGSLIDL